MKIHLCQNGTKAFYAGDGNWVDDSHYALWFGSCVAALDMALQLQLKDVFILIAFDNKRHNLSLPLDFSGPTSVDVLEK